MIERPDQGWEDQIQDAVNDLVDSLDSMNFSELNRRMQDTIDSVFEEWDIGGERKSYHTSQRRNIAEPGKYGYDQAVPQRRASDRGKKTVSGAGEPSKRKAALFAENPAGTIFGPIGIVLGTCMTVIFGFCTLACAGYSLGEKVASDVPLDWGITLFLGACLAGSVVLLVKGVRARRRIKRFRRYVQLLDGRTYITVAELASATGKDESFVQKDLRTMLEKGFFPYGRMDVSGEHLILDQATWKQYQESVQAYEERQKAEEQKQKEAAALFGTNGTESAEFLKTLEEGESYIRRIREANDAIPGEEISRKLDTLESLLRKIFTVLRQKPDQLPKLRKFMNFYMPTTLKLVETYRELDAQPVAGSNIVKAKQEIEDTMDTINLAYEKLFDSFFEEAAMDVTTDIRVLENMLAREGLTQSPFEAGGMQASAFAMKEES